MKKVFFVIALMVFLVACTTVSEIDRDQEIVNEEPTMEKDLKIATFAGGCFWCVESDFEKHSGIKEVVSGFAGGEEENPEYKEVASGKTGHVEAVQVHYDPEVISYKDLLKIFWRTVDPTDDEGQFVDRGFQYTTAIFYNDEEEKMLAEQSKEELEEAGKFDKPIVTRIVKFTSFYKAEEYHQDYYKKNPIRYNFYRSGSGRDQFVNNIWEEGEEVPIFEDEELEMEEEKTYTKPSSSEIKEMLTPLQYKVTQQNGTEKAFDNEYWDNTEEGIYVDVVSGEPLFSSKDKYKSGTGWPSFTKPLEESNIVEKPDRKLFILRTEVRSKHGDSHLGHVFDDGPEPTGLRYCMNSASLRFIPKDKLVEEGYGEYLELF